MPEQKNRHGGHSHDARRAVLLENAGVDCIVASGFEAGGHKGALLRAAEDSLMGTFSLVPLVVDRVKAPVIAAGGVADARGIKAALALGAQGVQIGTAFLACGESGASPAYKELLFDDARKDTVLTKGSPAAWRGAPEIASWTR
jgi:nitronate monooxygenase